MRSLTLAVFGVIVAVTLAGCTPGVHVPTAFDRAATDQDTVPSTVDFEYDDSRYVGTSDGAKIYLARSGSDTCVVVAEPDEEFWGFVTCGNPPFGGGSLGVSVLYDPDDPEGNWELLGDDVYVAGD